MLFLEFGAMLRFVLTVLTLTVLPLPGRANFGFESRYNYVRDYQRSPAL